MDTLLQFFLSSFISILAIINPISTIGVFLSMLRNVHPKERHKIALNVSIVAFFVLLFFSITGYLVFQIYSITIEAFRIAGGLVLLLIGIRMIFPQPHQSHPTVTQSYVVPLAIPMTSGPGAITTSVVLASQATSFLHEIALWTAIFFACVVNFLVLRFSDSINRKLGDSGLSALVKIMGLIVCSIGVQFIIVGLKASFPVLGG
ncbi:MAG: MarC family protein [Candidatus Micrarchaeota archaeon]|nr:MarC family protein [Candidatus Micrarchaeota archaeon]